MTWPDTSLLVSIGALIAAILVFYVRPRFARKALSYSVDTNWRRVDVDPAAAGDVEIRYRGEVVENIFFPHVSIRNSGGEPILAKDFDVPLSVSVGAGSRVLDLTARVAPADLNISLIVEGGTITLQPMLLNRGDSIELALTVGGPYSDVTVAGRIVGVSRMRRNSGPSDDFMVTQMLSTGGGGVFLIVMACAAMPADSPAWLSVITSTFGGLIVGHILTVIALWRRQVRDAKRPRS